MRYLILMFLFLTACTSSPKDEPDFATAPEIAAEQAQTTTPPVSDLVQNERALKQRARRLRQRQIN